MIKQIGEITNSKKLKIKGKARDIAFFQDSKVAATKRTFILAEIKVIIDEGQSIIDSLSINSLQDIEENPFMDIIGTFEIIKGNGSFILNDIKDIMGEYKDKYKYYTLNNLFINKKFRNKGYGSAFLKYVLPKVINDNNVLVTYAGASTLEYKKEPSKKEFPKIIDKVSKFYLKNNFISFNDYSQFNSGNAMLYCSNTEVMINVLEFYRNDKWCKTTIDHNYLKIAKILNPKKENDSFAFSDDYNLENGNVVLVPEYGGKYYSMHIIVEENGKKKYVEIANAEDYPDKNDTDQY